MTTLGFTAHGSSNIEDVEYDPDQQTLTVSFRDGSSYEYSGVPSPIFEAFEVARSKGSYHAAAIRDIYPGRRV